MSARMSSKADETVEFQEFWEGWRKVARETDGRGDARDCFLKHIRQGADPQDIVDGARYFLRTLKDKAFIPLAASWINKRAYEDMAEMERTYIQRQQERQKAPTNVVQLINLPPTHFLRQNRA